MSWVGLELAWCSLCIFCNSSLTESIFSELLQKDCAVTIHTKNLQILMTEMNKTKNELNPLFMQEIFRENTTRYNLRNNEFIQL